MSWHFENIGTREDVTAAIDESVALPHGMPASVGSYLKDAIAACTPPSGPTYLISVRSIGHRPMQGGGSNETSEVKIVRSGPLGGVQR